MKIEPKWFPYVVVTLLGMNFALGYAIYSVLVRLYNLLGK